MFLMFYCYINIAFNNNLFIIYEQEDVFCSNLMTTRTGRAPNVNRHVYLPFAVPFRAKNRKDMRGSSNSTLSLHSRNVVFTLLLGIKNMVVMLSWTKSSTSNSTSAKLSHLKQNSKLHRLML